MAAMKPRTGDGPMEAVKEGRLNHRQGSFGGRRTPCGLGEPDEAKELHDQLAGALGH